MTEYHVLTDGVSVRQPAGVTDEYGRERFDVVLARRGETVELDDDQAERLVRLGAIGDENDLAAVDYVDRVKAARPAEAAAMYAAVREGASVYDATVDSFGLDPADDEQVADELEPDTGPAGEAEQRDRLEQLKVDELKAEASSRGLEGLSRATKDELVDAIVAHDNGTATEPDADGDAGDE